MGADIKPNDTEPNAAGRIGTDPDTSALDVFCRAHDVDNLYVVDTSFFPSAAETTRASPRSLRSPWSRLPLPACAGCFAPARCPWLRPSR